MAADFDAAEQPELIQCEVTGRWVPADETVVVQGRRVCAEGKQLLLERLRSGETLPGELECPSVRRRIGATLIDGVCLVGAYATTAAIIAIVMLDPYAESDRPEDLQSYELITFVAVSVLQLAYFVFFHGRYGQTPGKMVARIRVANPDGSAITMWTAFLRALLYVGPQLARELIQVLLSGNFDDRPTDVVDGLTAVAVGIYGLTSTILALSDRQQQRALHDRLAGTRVVIK